MRFCASSESMTFSTFMALLRRAVSCSNSRFSATWKYGVVIIHFSPFWLKKGKKVVSMPSS